MAKLNQIIAIEKGIKSRVYGEIGELHKAVQKADLFNGFQKTYQSKEDGGETLPAERKRVQFVVPDVLHSVERMSTEWFDVTARKDWTNCRAAADVTIDGEILLEDVPITFLLFLEKQVTDLRTFVSCLPVLDEGEDWTKDENSGLYKTVPIQTHRTRKVQRPIVLYDATPEHPAQTQIITEDVIAGFWNQVKQSGAMPKPAKEALADRVEKLLQAVKQAREAANSMDEDESTPTVGGALFGYLFEE
jgi:hypothetical protein